MLDKIYHRRWRETHREQVRESCRKYKTIHKERLNAQQRLRYKVHRGIINSYKNKPCADCGIQYPPYVMDFDHSPDKEKSFGIGACHLMRISRLIAEIQKCEVVCANCHRIRTWTRKGYGNEVC